MADSVDVVSIRGMRPAHFKQLQYYLEVAEREGVYYGNKKQFLSRHENLKRWLASIVELVTQPHVRIPK